MPNLRDIRKRIEATLSINKITTTMEKIATVRMTRMMKRMEASRPYAASLIDMAEDLYLSALQEDRQQQFCTLTRRKKVQTAGVIFITSTQGLCAGFNVALNQELAALEEKLQNADIKVCYYTVGKKAHHYLRRRKVTAEYSLNGLNDRFTYEDIKGLRNHLMQDIELGKIDEVYMVYTHYLAGANYKVISEPLSPCKLLSKKIQNKKVPRVKPMICHPNLPELIKEFMPVIIFNRLYQALLESLSCEQIARRMAMRQASDAADDMINELRGLYHTTRQAKITREVNEMMGTVIALQRD
jgi:F-type H+-transporting ATPase subunit gamma